MLFTWLDDIGVIETGVCLGLRIVLTREGEGFFVMTDLGTGGDFFAVNAADPGTGGDFFTVINARGDDIATMGRRFVNIDATLRTSSSS
jgi:hypothetical protein